MKKNTNIPKEICNQLDILESSETLILIILVGVLIRFFYLKNQKEILIKNQLCPEDNNASNKNGFCIELASSLLIIYGLIGFYNQSKTITNTSRKAGNLTSDQCIDTVLSEIVLIIALIRLYQLFKSNSQKDNSLLESEEALI